MNKIQTTYETTVLVQNNDIKTQMYSKNALKYKINIIGLEGSEIVYPFKLWKYLLNHKKPSIFVYRYLNDSESLIKTLARFLSEILVLLTLKIFKIELYWVNHNVDRETHMNYSFLTEIRRSLISRQATKILVTNKFLVPIAKNISPDYKSKIDYLTFGYVEKENEKINEYSKKILEFIKQARELNNSKIGICVGNANYKTKHFELIEEFMRKSEETDFDIFMIIGGDISQYYQKYHTNIFEDVIDNPKVLIIDQKFDFQDEIIIPHIDFYWRVYEDLSTPYTALQASYYRKPIVSLNKGFLSIMIKEYKLGYIIDDSFSNLDDIYSEIDVFDTSNCDKFLHENNWNNYLERLF